jgi:hypothetical protein
MEERIGRIGRIETDFLFFLLGYRTEIAKKIGSNPPDPPNPFSHCIGIFNYVNNLNLLIINVLRCSIRNHFTHAIHQKNCKNHDYRSNPSQYIITLQRREPIFLNND